MKKGVIRMNKVILSPCKDCKKRVSACHDKCKKYTHYKKLLLEYKRKVMIEKQRM